METLENLCKKISRKFWPNAVTFYKESKDNYYLFYRPKDGGRYDFQIYTGFDGYCALKFLSQILKGNHVPTPKEYWAGYRH